MAIPGILKATCPWPVLVLGLVASCTVPQVLPPKAELPARPTAPRPAQPPAPPAIVSWQDAAITPGSWTWQGTAASSTARFADNVADLTCDKASKSVTMRRYGAARADSAVSIQTSSMTRTLPGEVMEGAIPAITLRLPARDPLLDAMAFSRGRFAVEVTGLATLYLPSWPEVSRVIEDCRT